MLGHHFYHGLIKKYLKIFGVLFNSIEISRFDANGVEIERMKVPLAYSPKDKLVVRTKQDPDIQRRAAITLPRMGFELTNMVYAPDRKLNRVNRIVVKGDDPNHMKTVFTPVPFDFAFALYVMVKNHEDATKIVEQILPFFTPDFTVTADLMPEMEDFKMDIPVTHTGVTINEIYEGQFQERQVLIYTLNFVLKGYLYGPVINRPLIKFVKTYSHLGNTSDPFGAAERIAVYPGLDANGNPTSNAAVTIDPNLIWFTDNFGDIIVHQIATGRGGFTNTDNATIPFNTDDDPYSNNVIK